MAGKNYPAGSYVVKAAQAFRPHVLDMFEPQDHPDDFPYPGGPPTRPYDNAGWTLAYQMGVKFDRVLDGFDGPFEKVSGLQKPAPGKVTATAAGGLSDQPRGNDAFTAINRLLAAGEEVAWITSGPQPGAFFVAGKGVHRGRRSTSSPPISGCNFERRRGASGRRRDQAAQAADRAGRSVRRLDAVRLDALAPRAVRVPVRGRVSAGARRRQPVEQVRRDHLPVGRRTGAAGWRRPGWRRWGGGGGGRGGGSRQNIPAEYQAMLGAYTAAQTGPQLKKFLEDGGTMLAVGRSAMNLAQLFAAAGRQATSSSARPTASTRPLPAEKFYVPGSVLRVAVDNTAPIAHGIANPVDVFFDNSPVFRLVPDAAMKGVRPVAWFDSATPLRSGWACGQGYLQGGVAVVEATVGEGQALPVRAGDHVPRAAARHVQVPVQRDLSGGAQAGGRERVRPHRGR